MYREFEAAIEHLQSLQHAVPRLQQDLELILVQIRQVITGQP